MAMEYRNLMEDIVLQNLDTVMAAEGAAPATPASQTWCPTP